MSQVKRLAIIIALCLIAYGGYYLYTGKGWLLAEGKESLADFYFNRGLHYFNGGAYDLPAAQGAFEQALAHSNGHYSYAYYELARIYFIESNFSSALADADAELQQFPDHAKVHYMKGLMYGYRKQYVQAEQEFIAYNQAVPRQWAGYNDLAWIYFSEGSYADAAATALQGLAVVPDNPWLKNSYAVAELNLGMYGTAEKYFTEAQAAFVQMSPQEWGKAYPGNNPADYEKGLAQIRETIAQNLALVHTKLNGE